MGVSPFNLDPFVLRVLQDVVGKYCLHPFCDRKLPIVADDFVDMNFGTGAVKITPAHDHNDYDCGKRNGLEFVEMMNDEGFITDVCPQFKVGVVNHMTSHVTITCQVYLLRVLFRA